MRVHFPFKFRTLYFCISLSTSGIGKRFEQVIDTKWLSSGLHNPEDSHFLTHRRENHRTPFLSGI